MLAKSQFFATLCLIIITHLYSAASTKYSEQRLTISDVRNKKELRFSLKKISRLWTGFKHETFTSSKKAKTYHFLFIFKKRIGKGEANFQVKKEHVKFKASTKRSKDVVHDLLIQQCWSY